MNALGCALAAALAVWLALPDGRLTRLVNRDGPRRRPSVLWSWVRSQFVSRSELARQRAVQAGVPAVCDLLAVCVEAGRPPRAALPVVASAIEEPTRSVLMSAVHQLELGVDETRVWAALGEQPGYREVCRDLARTVNSGTSITQLLRAHAREARTAVLADTRARARKVSVTAVIPLMVCYLPAFMCVGIVPIFGGLLGRLTLG